MQSTNPTKQPAGPTKQPSGTEQPSQSDSLIDTFNEAISEGGSCSESEFGDFPELPISILKHLDPQSFVRCRQVCHLFNKTILGSPEYTNEKLAIAAVENQIPEEIFELNSLVPDLSDEELTDFLDAKQHHTFVTTLCEMGLIISKTNADISCHYFKTALDLLCFAQTKIDRTKITDDDLLILLQGLDILSRTLGSISNPECKPWVLSFTSQTPRSDEVCTAAAHIQNTKKKTQAFNALFSSVATQLTIYLTTKTDDPASNNVDLACSYLQEMIKDLESDQFSESVRSLSVDKSIEKFIKSACTAIEAISTENPKQAQELIMKLQGCPVFQTESSLSYLLTTANKITSEQPEQFLYLISKTPFILSPPFPKHINLICSLGSIYIQKLIDYSKSHTTEETLYFFTKIINQVKSIENQRNKEILVVSILNTIRDNFDRLVENDIQCLLNLHEDKLITKHDCLLEGLLQEIWPLLQLIKDPGFKTNIAHTIGEISLRLSKVFFDSYPERAANPLEQLFRTMQENDLPLNIAEFFPLLEFSTQQGLYLLKTDLDRGTKFLIRALSIAGQSIDVIPPKSNVGRAQTRKKYKKKYFSNQFNEPNNKQVYSQLIQTVSTAIEKNANQNHENAQDLLIVGLDATCLYANQLGLSYSQHYHQKDEELTDEMKNNYSFIQENLSSLVQPLLQSNFTLTNGVFSSLYISSHFDPKCPIEKVLKLLYRTVQLNDIVSTDQSSELANILSTQSYSLWSKMDDTEKKKELVEDFFNIFTFPKSSSHEEIEYIADRFLELIESYPEMLIFLPPIVENAEASIPNNEEFLFNIYRQVPPIIAKVDNLRKVFAYPDHLFFLHKQQLNYQLLSQTWLLIFLSSSFKKANHLSTLMVNQMH